ncbi:MAG TPA: glutamate-5-semialdehyde dehydrogenase [Clostridia bacterium]
MQSSIQKICSAVKAASMELANYTTEQKNKILECVAQELIKNSQKILDTNKLDLEAASNKPSHYLDRLRLTQDRIMSMAQGVKDVINLPDPIGEVLDEYENSNKLKIVKVRVPLGVIGIIYEARPNVTVDVAALCIKSGNAVILRGSRDAVSSNTALVEVMKDAIKRAGFNPDIVGYVDCDHEQAVELMKANEYIDVLVPRGSDKLIKTVVQNSTIPVIETGTGNCHVYIHSSADLDMAVNVTVNAKVSRPSVCNAAESLLIDEQIYKEYLPKICQALAEHNVKIKGCPKTCAVFPAAESASEDDYYAEFLDYIISVKVVKDYNEAIDHINRYGTKHSEAIITQDEEVAKEFTKRVDAAAVYVNASTRFTDGGVFGFGAELGISTQKLHARGPMGLKELTSYKYVIYGNGQVRK